MQVYHHLVDLIGQTPILQLHRIEDNICSYGHIFAKLEYYNPAGSIKDRVAKQMLLDAIEKGFLKKGTTIIEPTSGNTGIGLCAVGTSLGFEVIIVMPDSMSQERITLMQAYGAKVVLTPGKQGMSGAIIKAEELAKDIPNSFIPSQFTNLNNPYTHELSTAPEIDEQMKGQIDIIVAGIGTGGTITGLGHYFKNKYPHIKIIGVEPYDSPLLSQGKSGPHQIQGIGANFVPEILDTQIYDEIITVQSDNAFETSRMLAKTEGILTGISSGAALYVSLQIAKKEENKDKNIVVILPDGGDRYLSTNLFKQ